jgi:ribosomal protein L16 Arg81 hydroxylase
MPFVPSSAEPRLWIGNAAKIATHNDPIDNVAVVAAGRRRFTLFPPEAEANLYMGPEHPTPAGTPVSMVHVTAPDWERFPLFERALAVAEEAELSPGDAVFIPRDWFHHVEALERFNVLVNYWWDSSASAAQA